MRKACGLLVMLSLMAVPASAQVSATINGQVKAETGGTPVVGARILVAGTSREVTTDSDGQFPISGISPGAHTIVITSNGFAPLSQPVTVTPGQTLVLDVRLPSAPTLTQELTVVGRIGSAACP